MELFTFVVDWDDFRDLQVAFLKASTPDGEIPSDHAINALLRYEASRRNIRYIISGMNFATESVSAPDWSYGHSDWRYIKDVHRRFGTVKLRSYPHFSLPYLALYVNAIRRVRTVSGKPYRTNGTERERALKIWIVNHYAIPASESGGTRHYSLARELVRRGHEVVILAADFHHGARSRRRGSEQSGTHVTNVDGVRFHWLRTPPYAKNGMARIWNMLSFARQIVRRATAREVGAPDVVLGSSPHPFAAIASQRVARRYGVPFVLEVRDLWPDSLVQVAGISPRHPLVLALGWLERYLYRTADAIVTLLPNAADHIVAHGGLPDRIVWVPNGVDFDFAPPMMPLKIRDAAKPFTVLYAGSHGQANALDSMLETARLLGGQNRPAYQFLFIGDGPEKERLRRVATAEGLEHVRFEQAVSKQQIYAMLQQADVLFASTRNLDLYAHGISFNKVFDYLAAGRPIVFGADCPGNPVEEAGAGLVVPPEDSAAMADAIQRIAAMTSEERWELGARGRRFAEDHYDMKKLAERLETVLVQAVLVHAAR